MADIDPDLVEFHEVDEPVVLKQGGPVFHGKPRYGILWSEPPQSVDAIPFPTPVQNAMRKFMDAEPAVKRPSWDEWALNLAAAVGTRADCTRRQVGAVILDPEHRVVATGYNGYPAGRPGCASAGACPRGQKSKAEIPPMASYTAPESRCDALHAEENAILYARRDLRGCTIYVNHEPCPNCRRVIAGTGIARMVWTLPGGGYSGEMV